LLIKVAKFILESAGIWKFIYEAIERRSLELQLAHPLKVLIIAEASINTGKVDARTLVRLLCTSMVPQSRKRMETPREPRWVHNNQFNLKQLELRKLRVECSSIFLLIIIARGRIKE